VFAIDLGTVERAQQLMELLQGDGFGYMAVSLGHADTLMSCSSISTSSELGLEAQRAAGLRPGLVRVSLGYTGLLEDRWAQLESALGRLGVV
jgi:methionine-gamma-lyase